MALLPINDDNPAQRAPFLTYLLITVNVGVYLLTPIADFASQFASRQEWECAVEGFLAQYAAIPRELVTGTPLPPGEIVSPVCRASIGPYEKSPFLSALFALFLHGGALHIISNMLVLFVFGPAVEQRMGHVRYLLFYLVCGYAATYGFAFTYPESPIPLVGASGAIAGVTGAYIVLFPRGRITSLIVPLPLVFRLPAWAYLGAWFATQWIAVGLPMAGDNVAYWAHIYGFLAGALWGLVLRRSAGRPASLLYGWR